MIARIVLLWRKLGLKMMSNKTSLVSNLQKVSENENRNEYLDDLNRKVEENGMYLVAA